MLRIIPYHFKDRPILIAGGFNAELDKLKSEDFEVPQCDPTLPRVLNLACTNSKQICTDNFAYRSSTNIAITLKDVHAEPVVPCPGLVTGSQYNIDYDQGIRKLPKVIGNHDPVRAKLTIRTLTPQVLSHKSDNNHNNQVPQSLRSPQPPLPLRLNETPGHGEQGQQPNDITHPSTRRKLVLTSNQPSNDVASNPHDQ